MATYKVASDYAGKVNGRDDVRWKAGSQVDVNKDDAAWVNRDAPGTLSEVGSRVAEVPDPPKSTLANPGQSGRRKRGGGHGGS